MYNTVIYSKCANLKKKNTKNSHLWNCANKCVASFLHTDRAKFLLSAMGSGDNPFTARWWRGQRYRCCRPKLITPRHNLSAWHIILWHPQSHWSHLQNHFNLLTTEPLFSLFPHQSFALKFFLHPHRGTVKIFHFRMDVHIFKHQVIHHTSLFFSHPTLKARHAAYETNVLCDTSTWASGETWAWQPHQVRGGWEDGGWEQGWRGRITVGPGELRIAEYWGKPRWSH